jgi:hypothetical protein
MAMVERRRLHRSIYWRHGPSKSRRLLSEEGRRSGTIPAQLAQLLRWVEVVVRMW